MKKINMKIIILFLIIKLKLNNSKSFKLIHQWVWNMGSNTSNISWVETLYVDNLNGNIAHGE
jgi:hypothetical protein